MFVIFKTSIKDFAFNKIILLIMSCINSVSFFVLINGATLCSFPPPERFKTRGPPLTCIFIICSEVLSGLISKAREDGILHGISIATNVFPISHLLYADDIILFCKAKPT